jgi:hypothetical protein
MAKKAGARAKTVSTDNAISLFDRENLEFLDALRANVARTSATRRAAPARSDPASNSSDAPNAESVFRLYRISDNDEAWGMGELNIKIIHRGRIRINRDRWVQVIDTCSDGCTENGIRKDFHLNILSHSDGVRLIYISYRYKQSGDKQRDSRRGILVDELTDIRELMMHLAFWFTAQPHAEENYSVWKRLIDEAMAKLGESSIS